MAYLLWRLQIHERYLSRLVDDFPDQLLFCIIATRRVRSVRLTASEMVNMNILQQHWTKILSNSRCGTSNDFREAFKFKHVLFSNVFPTTLEVATWFLSNVLRGFTRATTCCVTRRVPWCAVWPCRLWIITVWWTSFRWQDLRNLVKKRDFGWLKTVLETEMSELQEQIWILNDMSLHHSFNLFYINVYST